VAGSIAVSVGWPRLILPDAAVSIWLGPRRIPRHRATSKE
jgi:hypothetical protein